MAQVFFPSYSFLTIKAYVNLLLSFKKNKRKKKGGAINIVVRPEYK